MFYLFLLISFGSAISYAASTPEENPISYRTRQIIMGGQTFTIEEEAPDEGYEEAIAPKNVANVKVENIQAIQSFADLDALLQTLDLRTTALVLDFDETLARKAFTIGENSFYLVGSPDAGRTYRKTFNQALTPYGITAQYFAGLICDKIDEMERYEVLDPTLPDLLEKYGSSLGYKTILSGMQLTAKKQTLLESLGILNYITPSTGLDKSQALFMPFLALRHFGSDFTSSPPPSTIKTLIFVDNSPPVIDKFSKEIQYSIQTYFYPAVDAQELTVYPFLLTKFEDDLNENDGENLIKELATLKDVLPGAFGNT